MLEKYDWEKQICMYKDVMMWSFPIINILFCFDSLSSTNYWLVFFLKINFYLFFVYPTR